LAGNAGATPELFEMLIGDAKLIGQTANRVQTTLNKAYGQIEPQAALPREAVSHAVSAPLLDHSNASLRIRLDFCRKGRVASAFDALRQIDDSRVRDQRSPENSTIRLK
jgi:hypothetical protein